MNHKELIARLRVGAGIERERVVYSGWAPLADEAAEAIEALQAEVSRLEPLQFRQAPCHKFCESTAFTIEIRNLKKQLAEAQRDAKRYRNLFNGNKVYSQFMRAYAGWDGSDGKAGFDAAIDAAMKGTA